MELKSKFCFNREEVTKFINDNNITINEIPKSIFFTGFIIF